MHTQARSISLLWLFFKKIEKPMYMLYVSNTEEKKKLEKPRVMLGVHSSFRIQAFPQLNTAHIFLWHQDLDGINVNRSRWVQAF